MGRHKKGRTQYNRYVSRSPLGKVVRVVVSYRQLIELRPVMQKPMQHTTPLSSHFKGKHLWFDISVLIALFVVASYYPLFKIVPLLASLELFSFFSFHLMARRSRLQLQGFLGGFISSTAVFLQMLNDKRFISINSKQLSSTLLLAACAMLGECLFILYFLAEDIPLIIYVPFAAQLFFFVVVVLFVQAFLVKHDNDGKHTSYSLEGEMLNDHPIVWMNVAKLSLFIFTLIAVMHFIGNELGLSRDISTLLVALFEAHAILVSVITEWSLDPDSIELLKLVFLILLGNTLSKSYLVYKGKNLQGKWLFVGLLFCGFMVSVFVTLGWQEINVSSLGF